MDILQDNMVFSPLIRQGCGNRVRLLSQKLIDEHKRAETLRQEIVRRKTRVTLWNLIHKELSDLYVDISRSYSTYRHYLTFSTDELMDFPNGTYYTRDGAGSGGLKYRAKAFVNIVGGNPNGIAEAEYWEFIDCNGNNVRRPFWIRIETAIEKIFVLKHLGGVSKEFMERIRDENHLIVRDGPLRTGPIRRQQVENVLNHNFPLPLQLFPKSNNRKFRSNFGKPMYIQLDESEYINKRIKTESISLNFFTFTPPSNLMKIMIKIEK